MKNRYAKKRIGLSILILVSMTAAALLSSGAALADDSTPALGAQGEASPTATQTPAPTLTPTATLEQVSVQQDGGTDTGGETPTTEPTTEPTQTSVDVSSDASAEASATPDPAAQPTDTPELALTETPTLTPTATQEAELVVPLLMPADESNIIPGQYIVIYKNDRVSSQGLKSQRDKVKQKGGKIKAEFNGSGMKGFAAQMDKDTLKSLRQDPDIAYIEPDQYIYAADEIVGAQSIQGLSGSGTWGLDRIDQIALTRDYLYHYPTSAGAGVHVYVLDSGINASHTEFGGRVTGGYDFVDNDSDPSDVYGHGTAVAGVIGASAYGVAKLVSMHSVRVLDSTGNGQVSDVVEGLNWVIANHGSPAVINMSLASSSISTTLNTGVQNAINAGIQVVVASGNVKTTESIDACDWSPGSVTAALTIGATTSSDSRASYSTYGSCIDLFAPGTGILTTTMNGGTGIYDGTSIASPMVAGAAALYLADHPGASPAQVASALTAQATSDVLTNIGTGSPNLLLAVSSDDVDQVVLSTPANASLTNLTDVALAWTAGYNNDSYTLEVDDSSAFDSLFYTTSTSTLSGTVSGLTEGTWYWRVQAANAYGTTGAWSETWSFTVDLTPPSAPTQSSPEDGAYVVANTTFSWGTVADAAAYQFKYNNETYEYLSDELSGTSVTPPAIGEGTYYWYVQARDAAGNWSDWSAAYTVTVVPPGPDGPTLTSPTYGKFLNTDTPDLTWTAVTGAVAYQVQLSSTYAFDTVLESSGDFAELTYTAGPLADGKYYWRVRSKSIYGIYGSWSAVRNFTLDTSKPVAPDLINPISGSTSVGMPVFSWGAVTDAQTYQFEYGISDNYDDYVYRSEELTATYFQPPSKNTDVTYYWFARARDMAGNWSDWSASNIITVLANNPGRVNLSAPANKSLTNDDTPVFNWEMQENSAYYHIQIADSKYFTNIIQEADGLTELSYTADPLDPDGVYFWRVRGRNGADAYGTWSSYRYFTLDTSAPAAPVLLSPADDATYAGQPTFKWSRPSSAKYYKFKAVRISDLETVYESAELRTYKFKAPALDKDDYYWYAQARDVAGNWSAWSAPFTIHIVPPAPSRVTLSAPAKGSLTTDTQPVLSWNVANYADTYELQISTSSRFGSLLFDLIGLTETTYDALPALDDARYYWRVRAVNTEGVQGSWSSAFYFTVDTLAPDAPGLYKPVDGADSSGTPTFVWLRPSTSKYYQFKYADAAVPETDLYVSDELRTYKFKPPTMELGSYVWYVRARDAAGNWSEWSSPYTVNIVPPVPARASLSEPLKAQYIDNTLPTLSWDAVDYADTYDLQVSTSSRFTTLVIEETGLTDLSYTPAEGELQELKYYWRVRAVNAGGTGSWSSVFYFAVDLTAPAAPLLRSPAEAAVLIGSPTFKWYKASGAKYYQLAYNTVNDPQTAVYTSPWVTQTAMKISFMDFLTDYYWFVRAQDAAGNESEWSQGRRIFLNPPKPYQVVTTSPAKAELIDDNTPTLSWNAATYAYTYEYQIDDSSRFRSVDYEGVSAVAATSVTTEELASGKWYWRVRAVNEIGVAGSWSAARYFTLYPKFETNFDSDGDLEGWAANTGAAWSVSSGSLNTAGLPSGYTTSASYSDITFNDFTYEATMRMDAPAGGESNTYGLVLRGTPAFDAWFDWTDGIYFTVRQVNDSLTSTQYTCALAYKISSGTWSYLGGSCGQAAYADWNTLKVYAKSRTLKFYVNDSLVLSTSARGPYSGRLGVVSWGENVTSASVDAAAAGAPVEPVSVTSLSAQSVNLPAGLNPEDVFNQMKK